MKSDGIINPLDILIKLSWGESEDVEFKSAKGGLPGSLWETYSAMANTQGGVILLGVQDDGSISGISDPDKLKTQFWGLLNNRQKVSLNLLSNHDVQSISHPHGDILAIRVRPAARRERPVYVGHNPLTGTYRRDAEGDYHCTEQEVRRMLADSQEEPADSRILESFTLNDLDLPSLHQYRQRFASRQPTHPWLDIEDINFLKKLNGWRSCRKGGHEGLTVAGLLMFGRDETIREAIPQYHVDFRERLSQDPTVRWTDRITQDGTWPGNLYQFYHRVIQRLSQDLKLPFELDSDMIRKGESPVHVAVREALVNALIHADYQGQGGVVVEKYVDRFEFSNPGSLLISLDQMLFGGVSECRNKSLQTMFTMIGAAEKAGSGIDKINIGWRSQHWRSPIVKEQVHPDRVTWVLPMLSLIPEASLERLRDQFGSKLSKFNNLEIQALVTADVEGHVTNARMRQITGHHTSDITKILQDLVGRGILLQNGQALWTQYYLPLHKDSHSLHKDSHSLHENSNDQWSALTKIAEVARKNKRLPPKEMEAIILKLCKNHWLTRRQISDLLQRNPESLRSRFLASMVTHGLLRLRYPDRPNRIDQAYQTA